MDQQYEDKFPKAVQTMRASVLGRLEHAREQEELVTKLEEIYSSIVEDGTISIDESYSSHETVGVEIRAWVESLDTEAVESLLKWGATASYDPSEDKYKLVHEVSLELERVEP